MNIRGTGKQIYTCNKCNKSFDHHGHYKTHVNRKTDCRKTSQPKSYSCMYCDSVFVNKSNLNRHVKKYHVGQMTVNKSKEIKNKFQKDNMCCFCKKKLANKSNLNRHQKGCKMKQVSEERETIYKTLLDKLEEQEKVNMEIVNANNQLKAQNDKLMVTINNGTINNTTNQTVNNNTINNNYGDRIVAFGKEDLTRISDEVCKRIIGTGFFCVPNLVDHVHFNKDIPEYHNVYIPNKKEKYAMTFDGNFWQLENRDEVINKLIEDKQAFLEEQFYEFIETLSESARRKFNKFLEQCGEEAVKERMFNAIKMILYNKKHFIIDSRRVIGHDPFVNKQIEFVL